MMKDLLARIESSLQNAVERSLERIAGGRLTADALAVILVRAMETSLRKDDGGRSWAPDEYDLMLHPADFESLLGQTPDLKGFLKQAVLQAARENGYPIAEEPRIALEADQAVARNKVRVQAFHSRDVPDQTQQMPSLTHRPSVEEAGAALVGIDGKVYLLQSEVVHIGRLPDNQIVFKDRQVSRRHAQVRLHEGRHVIYDLGSKAGTRVNGKPVRECVLQHGDLITFAGNRLVYQLGDQAPTDGGGTA